jgi:Ca2+-binding RTX toxin-like protein
MSGTGGSTVIGGSGNELFSGGNGSDWLSGGDGNDSIAGLDGNDSILGGNGNDAINGGLGNDSLDGGTGTDWATYAGATGAVTVNLGTGTSAGAAGNDSLTGIENVSGGNFADSLLGDGLGNVLNAGQSTLVAGDSLGGGAGNDTLIGDAGSDLLDGGNDADSLSAGADNDTLSGGLGNDTLDGGTGTDWASYADATGAVTVNLGSGTSSGADGNDSLVGIAIVLASAFNDSLVGGSGDGQQIFGEDGNDTLAFGSGSNQDLLGGAGNDLYIAGSSSLTLRINDSGGSDTLSFQGVTGGSISAAALGLVGGIEAINLAGGGNTLNLSASRVLALSDTDVLRVFGSGSDLLVFDDAASWTRGATADGFVTFTTGNASVIAAQSLAPAPTGPTTGDEALSGTSGADTIDLLAGNDSYLGLDGADSILGNDGNDTLSGGDGTDTLNGGAGNDLLQGGNGNDSLSGGEGADTLYGGAGNDFFFVNDPLDQIIETSGGGADTIITSVSMTMPDHVEVLQIATGISGITITGGAGNDMLIGNGLANTFVGVGGDDVILVANVTLADIYALFAI